MKVEFTLIPLYTNFFTECWNDAIAVSANSYIFA